MPIIFGIETFGSSLSCRKAFHMSTIIQLNQGRATPARPVLPIAGGKRVPAGRSEGQGSHPAGWSKGPENERFQWDWGRRPGCVGRRHVGRLLSNFPNKEALLEKVIETCVGEPFIDSESGSLAQRQDRLREWLAMYISAGHRVDPASGCVMPTLSADVARANPQIRAAYQRKMLELVRRMSNVLDGAEPDRARRAWSIIAMMVGAIAISRAMPDGEAADQALDSALQTATALVAPDQV